MRKLSILKYILIVMAALLAITIFILAPESIEVLKSFFTIKEKIFVVIFVLLVFLFPMIFRIVNDVILFEYNKFLYERDKNICPIIRDKHCCIDVYNKNKFLSDYRLTLVDVMNDKECDFGMNNTNNNRREVWIFSYNLETEILGDVTQSIAVKNVENNIRYVYFHTNNAVEKDSIEINKHAIISGVSSDKQSLLSFIPLEEDSTEGIDILAQIIGSIMFVVASDENFLKISYFSLRGNNNDEPIYFRLPRCMNSNYYEYFAKRKSQYERR